MKIERLDRARIDEAAVALGRAFQDDPLQSHVLPDPGERRERSPAHFRPVLHYGLQFGEVYATAGAIHGAAVWLPPGETVVTEERAAAAGLDRLAEALGEEAAGRFFAVLGFLDPFHTADAPEPHWYAMVVGVEPAAQGRGLGRGLMQPILDRARAAGHSCYLETAQPANVGFYQRLGFRVLRDLVEPASGLRLWTLRWDPS